MQTKMLYMEDNYIKDFDAEIIALGENYLVLNQTAFYPEGGGQETDLGTISIDDVQLIITKVKRESGQVRHYYKEDEIDIKKGQIVRGKLDWNRRMIHMRYHTAIHVLSTYMKEKFGAEVVGNNISTRNGRADFNLKNALTNEELQNIEKDLNELIDKNMPIEINFMPREEAKEFLKQKGYQVDYMDMVPKSVKTFRIIAVDDYDYASCAGTHVANTSEIGKVKVVKRRSMGKGKERITLALED